MRPVWEFLKKNWQVTLIIVLALGFVYMLGARSVSGNVQASAIPTAEPTQAVPICQKGESVQTKFTKIETVKGETTFTFQLPTGFNSAVDFGDGSHSQFKSNTTGQTLAVSFTHSYVVDGKYIVGLYTFDMANSCDNGAALAVMIPAVAAPASK